MRAKICGISTLSDALISVQHGAWALGFNFYTKSPRYISKKLAKLIIDNLPKSVVKIGIFVNTPGDIIANDIEYLGLDLAQVHENIKAPVNLKKRMILSVQASEESELPDSEILKAYGYILLDAPRNENGLLGGTGRMSNWNLANQLSLKYHLILAGGLTPTNVERAINTTRPFAVDVSSGVESAPGIKNQLLIKEFLGACYDVK